MGLFDSGGFSFSDPTSMALLGAIAGLGQASAPSRLPVTNGMVLGGLAGGLTQGNTQALQNQKAQNEIAGQNLALGNNADTIRMQALAYGMQPPSMGDIRNGKWEGLLANLPHGTTLTSLFNNFPGAQQPSAPMTPTAAPTMPNPSMTAEAPNTQANSFVRMSDGTKVYNGQVVGRNGELLGPYTGGGTPVTDLAALQHVQNAILDIESGGNPNVKDSSAGAIGPMQIMPSTGKQYGATVDQLRDPNTNLEVGGRIVTDLYGRYNGDPEATAVAYNAGPGTADKWLASGRNNAILPKETQNYLTALHQRLDIPAGGAGTQLAQAFPNAGSTPMAAQSAGGVPNMGSILFSARVKQALGFQLTPVEQSLAAASMAPAGSMQQQLLVAQAYKNAGINPFIGGERRGSPVFRYDPATNNYRLTVQNPQLPEGAIEGPNGQIMMAPGALGAIGAVANVQSGGKASGELPYRFHNVGQGETALLGTNPYYTAPKYETVVDSQGNAHPVYVAPPQPGQAGPAVASGAGNLTPGGALGGGGSAASPQGPLTTKLGPMTEETLKGVGETNAKTRQANIDAATAAQQQQATLTRLIQDAPNFYTGPFAQHIQDAKAILRLFPGGDAYANSVASYEDFTKNAGTLTRQAVHDTSPRAAVQEFKLIGAALPNPEMSPIGLRRVLGEYQGLNDYRIAKAQAQAAWEQQHGVGNVTGFETDWQGKVSPYAFIAIRMQPDDLQAMLTQVARTKAGQDELTHLNQQMQFIKNSGLEKFIQ